MTLATSLTRRLGIEHPVLLAPMDLVADAALRKQRTDLQASQQLGKIVIDLSAKRALAETAAIRAPSC